MKNLILILTFILCFSCASALKFEKKAESKVAYTDIIYLKKKQPFDLNEIGIRILCKSDQNAKYLSILVLYENQENDYPNFLSINGNSYSEKVYLTAVETNEGDMMTVRLLKASISEEILNKMITSSGVILELDKYSKVLNKNEIKVIKDIIDYYYEE